MSLPPYGYDDQNVIASKRLLQLLEENFLDEASLRATADELGFECRYKIDELLEAQDDTQIKKSKEILQQMLSN